MTDAAKGGWVELTPEEIERQASGPTRVVWLDVLEECNIGEGSPVATRRYIADYLRESYPGNPIVTLLAEKVQRGVRSKMLDKPEAQALLDIIHSSYPNDFLLQMVVNRLDPKQRVRKSNVTRDALAITTVMGLMLSNPNMTKAEAVALAANELCMSTDNVRKLPHIKNLKLR